MSILRDDLAQSQNDHLDEIWATDIPPLPIDSEAVQGSIYGRLEDLQGRFNVNNLIDNNKDGSGISNTGSSPWIHHNTIINTSAASWAGGIDCKKTTVACPNMTPYVERFVRSIKSECLNKMLIFGESHLRYVVNEYMKHYHTERPHQGIGNNMIEPPPPGKGKIVCHERLGGLLKSYRRAA